MVRFHTARLRRFRSALLGEVARAHKGNLSAELLTALSSALSDLASHTFHVALSPADVISGQVRNMYSTFGSQRRNLRGQLLVAVLFTTYLTTFWIERTLKHISFLDEAIRGCQICELMFRKCRGVKCQ